MLIPFQLGIQQSKQRIDDLGTYVRFIHAVEIQCRKIHARPPRSRMMN